MPAWPRPRRGTAPPGLSPGPVSGRDHPPGDRCLPTTTESGGVRAAGRPRATHRPAPPLRPAGSRSTRRSHALPGRPVSRTRRRRPHRHGGAGTALPAPHHHWCLRPAPNGRVPRPSWTWPMGGDGGSGRGRLKTAFSTPRDGRWLRAMAWSANTFAIGRTAPSSPTAIAARPRTHTRVSTPSEGPAAFRYQCTVFAPSEPGSLDVTRGVLWTGLAGLIFVILLPPRVSVRPGLLSARGLLMTNTVRTDSNERVLLGVQVSGGRVRWPPGPGRLPHRSSASTIRTMTRAGGRAG